MQTFRCISPPHNQAVSILLHPTSPLCSGVEVGFEVLTPVLVLMDPSTELTELCPEPEEEFW